MIIYSNLFHAIWRIYIYSIDLDIDICIYIYYRLKYACAAYDMFSYLTMSYFGMCLAYAPNEIPTVPASCPDVAGISTIRFLLCGFKTETWLPKQCPKIKQHTNPGFILDTRIFMYMIFMMIYVCIYQWWFSAEYHHRSKPSINHQLASPTTTTTRGRIVQGSLGGSVKPWWKNGCWPISLI